MAEIRKINIGKEFIVKFGVCETNVTDEKIAAVRESLPIYIEEAIRDKIVENGEISVEPVRHVKNRAKYFGETLCPNCGIHLDETSRISEDENDDGDIIYYDFQPSFCANCGAKLDGDKND